MCHTVHTTFVCEPASVRAARDWVRGQLSSMYDSLDADLVDDIGLAVSELVTNCVRADAHQLSVGLVAHRGEVIVSTTDDAPGTPLQLAPDHSALSGRGLQIVAALTTEWGVTPAEGQKTVWGRFALATGPVGSFDCGH